MDPVSVKRKTAEDRWRMVGMCWLDGGWEDDGKMDGWIGLDA